MRNQPQAQEQFFFLATANVAVHVKNPFQIDRGIIETENFVPEALMIHHLQGESEMTQTSESFTEDLPVLELESWTVPSTATSFYSDSYRIECKSDDEDNDEDEDWDEDEEDWDEDIDEEDWDEEDEEWDEDEDWDEEEGEEGDDEWGEEDEE